MAVGIRAREVSDNEAAILDCCAISQERLLRQEEDSRVRAAFARLSHKEQFLLEKRNGIFEPAWSFEKIATAYEYSSTQSAERAYKKVVRKLQRELAV